MTKEDLIATYGPQNLYIIAQRQSRVIFGQAPTLRDLYAGDLAPVLLKILTGLIQHLEQYTSARVKLNDLQRQGLANVLICRYPHLTITQVHLFILLCMAGEFGKLYDHLDPMDISTALHTYVHEYIPKYVREHWYDREHIVNT